jgi:hypothetical protein
VPALEMMLLWHPRIQRESDSQGELPLPAEPTRCENESDLGTTSVALTEGQGSLDPADSRQ